MTRIRTERTFPSYGLISVRFGSNGRASVTSSYPAATYRIWRVGLVPGAAPGQIEHDRPGTSPHAALAVAGEQTPAYSLASMVTVMRFGDPSFA